VLAINLHVLKYTKQILGDHEENRVQWVIPFYYFAVRLQFRIPKWENNSEITIQFHPNTWGVL
jgi:hypothetical protein